ncbi:plasmid stabilization system [Arthrobacter sp. PAMC 25486]|uniref:type II toxin-antitoxin system RelE family toxin n=1 Tax=Arthrobacter sp. PAMC 25486 TaxID=1494608 RepID=UPI0005362063|nr:type II toxin-antitoxin system RelE/ParE family toxin [Arthrobacter sp. PAMC 25486]AIY03445.1 plasmid stabilization system [Arthrobacter sp. PAMC 25486]
MSYEVIVSPTASRDMQRIPPRIVPAIIEFVYSDLSRIPQRVGKPLERKLTGYYSARRGPYRVLFSIDEGQIAVMVAPVAHRADVYPIH